MKSHLKTSSRFCSLILLVALLSPGCFYYNYNRNFFAECRKDTPEIRTYAINHLPNLSEGDKRTIKTTDPRLAHANYIEVHFKWSNLCEVVSGAPPNCHPFKVWDLRHKK